MIRTIMVALALSASLWTLSTAAQSGRGSMSGYVALDGAAAIARVELSAASPSNEAHYEVNADSAGLFRIDEVLMGEYRLRISAPEYKAYETTLYVPSDFAGRIAVVLKPKSRKKGD